MKMASSTAAATATGTGTGSLNGNGCCPQQQQQAIIGDSDMGDSRKRPLDGEFESGVTKRSHHAGGDGTYHLKILVPSVAAGAIIGKGGETIAQLQKETGARVKMSKSNDFYPGTTERVCLITGTIEAIMHVHSFIMEKIRDKPDPNAKPAIDFDNKQPAEREKQVKILVPNSTAGMIIGKGGNYIKQIKEESGSYVQISQKAKDQSLSERCITVIGEMEFNRQACAMILSKIMEDPQSGSCLNVSYADVTGPVANFNPTGSPFANSGSPTNSGALVGAGGFPQTNGFSSPGGAGSSGGGNVAVGVNGVGAGAGGGLGLGFNLAAALMGAGAGSPLNVVQVVENLKVMLRNSGYSDQATLEIGAAVNTLAGYGVLGLALGSILQLNGGVTAVNGLFGAAGTGGGVGGGGGGGGGPGSGGGGSGSNVTAMDTTPASTAVLSSNGMGTNNVFGPIGSISGGVSLPVTPRSTSDHVGASDGYDPFRRTSPAPGSSVVSQSASGAVAAANAVASGAAGLHVNNNSFGLGTSPPGGVMGLRKSPTPADKGGLTVDPTKIEMEVGENIVGAILGPGGKSLVEIQHFSGANIQISKKGIFSPGTRNRIVTITGTPNGIGTAQYLIEQRIGEEEAKRARQNMLSVVR